MGINAGKSDCDIVCDVFNKAISFAENSFFLIIFRKNWSDEEKCAILEGDFYIKIGIKKSQNINKSISYFIPFDLM